MQEGKKSSWCYLAGALEHLTLIIRAISDLNGCCEVLGLVLCVTHSNQVSVSDPVQAVARRANLLVHLKSTTNAERMDTTTRATVHSFVSPKGLSRCHWPEEKRKKKKQEKARKSKSNLLWSKVLNRPEWGQA